MATIEFNGFSFSTELTFCPKDASGWDRISIDRDEERSLVGYKCGSSRTIQDDGLLRISQSDLCVRNELKLLEASETELQSELRETKEANTLLQSQLDVANSEIEVLEAQVAALEGGNRAARFVLTFGTPVSKGLIASGNSSRKQPNNRRNRSAN